MAADILAYKAKMVPVGDDQLPHLEVAREIARKINKKYGLNLPEPEQFKSKGHLVPSLIGEGKMSKSIEGSYINLTDSLEIIKQRLAKVPTDEGRGTKLPEKGGVASLLALVELFEGSKKRKSYEKAYLANGIRYAELKNELAEAIYKELKPIQERRQKFERDSKFVDRVLTKGAKKAQKIARETLNEIKKKIGLI
jgi:tryptophanyl-tRNA synthetase